MRALPQSSSACHQRGRRYRVTDADTEHVNNRARPRRPDPSGLLSEHSFFQSPHPSSAPHALQLFPRPAIGSALSSNLGVLRPRPPSSPLPALISTALRLSPSGDHRLVFVDELQRCDQLTLSLASHEPAPLSSHRRPCYRMVSG